MRIAKFVHQLDTLSERLPQIRELRAPIAKPGNLQVEVATRHAGVERVNKRKAIARKLRLGHSQKAKITQGDLSTHAKNVPILSEVGPISGRNSAHECGENPLRMNPLARVECRIALVP
jgi:hypothetical protein